MLLKNVSPITGVKIHTQRIRIRDMGPALRPIWNDTMLDGDLHSRADGRGRVSNSGVGKSGSGYNEADSTISCRGARIRCETMSEFPDIFRSFTLLYVIHMEVFVQQMFINPRHYPVSQLLGQLIMSPEDCVLALDLVAKSLLSLKNRFAASISCRRGPAWRVLVPCVHHKT